MDKKSMRLFAWHLLPAAYLVVLCGVAMALLPVKPMGWSYAVDPIGLALSVILLVGVGWAAVSGGLLLDRLKRQREGRA